jgi:diguanylate cyclase
MAQLPADPGTTRRPVPWRGLSAPCAVLLALGCDALVGVLRDVQGGRGSAYGALLILPVLLAAFTADRKTVLLVVAAVAATLIVPIVAVGAPKYPGAAWSGAMIVGGVAAIVGLATEYVVRTARRQTEVAEDRADLLDRLVATHTAIATSDFALVDLLGTVAEAARELTGAEGAVVQLPEGDALVYRAVAGSAAPFLGLRYPLEGSASGECLATGEMRVVADTETAETVNRDVCRRIGIRSMVIVPLMSAGHPAAALEVHSSLPNAVGADEARVLALLGPVIGTGLARAELMATMAAHARTDSLTGLANRRNWDDQLVRAIAHAERTHETLSVVVCDLDHLKVVNDREGHGAGDAFLRDVADRWREGARASDLVARIGGDEFALLLPGADEAGATEVVTRLLERLPSGRSVSFGVAEWDMRETASELLARADARMYAAKRRGRSAPTPAR